MNILFLSHGGGPLPLLKDNAHCEMVTCLEKIVLQLQKPSAIVVISAHWEETVPTITSAAFPGLLYDYYGFPQESYEIKYPCPGETQLALKIYDALKKNGFESQLDEKRGFDHGLFVPLKIMYPEAKIPCVQLSLMSSLDPATHIHIGEALRSLQSENVLIVGSGFSFHNLKEFFLPNTKESEEKNKLFEKWLMDTCSNRDYSEKERSAKLIHWFEAPNARYCHPREEHLLPLHVCYGAAQSACSKLFSLQIMGKTSSMYYWSNRN